MFKTEGKEQTNTMPFRKKCSGGLSFVYQSQLVQHNSWLHNKVTTGYSPWNAPKADKAINPWMYTQHLLVHLWSSPGSVYKTWQHISSFMLCRPLLATTGIPKKKFNLWPLHKNNNFTTLCANTSQSFWYEYNHNRTVKSHYILLDSVRTRQMEEIFSPAPAPALLCHPLCRSSV